MKFNEQLNCNTRAKTRVVQADIMENLGKKTYTNIRATGSESAEGVPDSDFVSNRYNTKVS